MFDITSRKENDYLVINATAKIDTDQQYQELVKQYCDEAVKNGSTKLIIDESKVDYAQSLLLQSEIVSFYSSGDLPGEFREWKIACIIQPGFMIYGEFWEKLAREKGFNQKAFTSMESARTFMNQ